VIKERHTHDLEAPGSLIKMVGAALDNERYPHETAVLKLLLAVYDELLYDHPSDLDLGRFYLRIAWMFRHLQIGQASSVSDGVSRGRDDYEKAVTDLEIWLAGWKRNLEYLTAAGDVCFKSEPSADAFDGSLTEQFTAVLSRAGEFHRAGEQLISDLRSLAADARATGTAVSENVPGNAFHEYPDFQSFLARLTTSWNGVPRDEFEARRFAARYYKNAFETGKEISHGNQTLQAAYLIAELSRQIGDHDTARQYFNTTVKMGQEYINEIRGDRTRTALARKILELALAQGKRNLAETK
jgi:tetratricopeptide (TPR) repeat protein